MTCVWACACLTGVIQKFAHSQVHIYNNNATRRQSESVGNLSRAGDQPSGPVLPAQRNSYLHFLMSEWLFSFTIPLTSLQSRSGCCSCQFNLWNAPKSLFFYHSIIVIQSKNRLVFITSPYSLRVFLIAGTATLDRLASDEIIHRCVHIPSTLAS